MAYEKQKKYLISAPLMNRSLKRSGREEMIRQLKTIGTERVFLPLSSESICGGTREEELTALKENCEVLKSEGFTVGAWFWAFQLPGNDRVTYMESPSGKISPITVCPADGELRKTMGQFVQDVAKCGVDMIMFDDDLRYGFQDMGFGCACPIHRRLIENRLGRQIGSDELKAALLSGKGGPVRKAFVEANGEALETFCKDMRTALDEAAPDVRLGFCACITSWDLDGTTPDRLSRLLAGKTRPFYRLIGAPYWAAMRAWGNKLGDVIELERAEAARRRDPEIEIFSEGDTYPRPRFATPASFLECFDTAMRASGCTDGILKYAQDYSANADYETGYIEAAVRDLDAYGEIDRLFDGKKAVGIRVYDKPDRYASCDIPADSETEDKIQMQTFPATQRFAVANSLPTTYEGTGVCGLAFGDDVDAVISPEKGGLILDVSAALKLSERGVDVGISSAGEAFKVSDECFLSDNNHVSLSGAPLARELSLRPGAEVLSVSADKKKAPLSFFYRNPEGACFLIYAFEGYWNDQSWYRVYDRARQIAEFASRASEPFPVFCPGHPELYVLVKTDGEKTAVGLWNLFADAVYDAEVFTGRTVHSVRGIRGNAGLSDGKLTVEKIPAFDFVLFEIC